MSREHPPGTPADEEGEPSLCDILNVVQSMDSPGVTTTDMSIILGCSPDTARRRLDTLFDQGHVERRKMNQQTPGWGIERTPTEESDTAAHLKAVDGPRTNAVELIEASRDEQ